MNEQRNILKGGFHELIVDEDANSINCESFENDCNQEFANLQCIGERDARYMHSYLVSNNKYLVVFYNNQLYNVYDMQNDKWMLNRVNQGEKGLSQNDAEDSRSMVINDQIIILSKDMTVYFYFIGNDHSIDPVLIHE